MPQAHTFLQRPHADGGTRAGDGAGLVKVIEETEHHNGAHVCAEPALARHQYACERHEKAAI